MELTQVKISHLTEDILRAQDEEYLASKSKPKSVLPSTTVVLPKQEPTTTISPEELERLKAEHELRLRWERAVAYQMVRDDFGR